MEEIEREGVPLTENTVDMNHQNNDIVLPYSMDLDWAQIIYAIHYKRLIFINNYKTWSDFFTGNGSDYIDYTPEELCRRFLKRVLPNIFEYELNEDELHLLNLLDLSPHFTKSDTGFNAIEQTGSLTFPANQDAVPNFSTSKGLLEGNLGKNVESNRQIIVTGSRELDKIHRQFNFNAENAALLSAVLCTDEELSHCELLTSEKIHKHLKVAKITFENSGEQLNNINATINVLIKKLETLSKLKQAVTKLVDKSFREQNDI